MRKKLLPLGTAMGVLLGMTTILANYDGSIFTTLGDGTEVNQNLFDAKEDVYLNGGPGKGSPTNANGLPDGVYVFMVTSPSGVLLSTDAAQCRQLQVTGGLVVGATGPCPHENGALQLDGGRGVQLIPYDDTPNPGGEYKAWLTPVGEYLCPLTAVTCGEGKNGFVDSESKTDNFKVDNSVPDEIDTRFHAGCFGCGLIDGLSITWRDTHGASNRKYSYFAPELWVMHEAHVEAPEIGTHAITITDQPGCSVGDVYVAGSKQRRRGPQTVNVKVTKAMKNKGTFTVFVDVVCR